MIKRFATAAIIVTVLSPLFFVGALGGAGVAMLFQDLEGPPIAALGLVGGMLLILWASLRLIDWISVSRLAKSEFWKTSTRRVWKFAAFVETFVGAIGAAMALFRA